jgi:hypothetical protein
LFVIEYPDGWQVQILPDGSTALFLDDAREGVHVTVSTHSPEIGLLLLARQSSQELQKRYADFELTSQSVSRTDHEGRQWQRADLEARWTNAWRQIVRGRLSVVVPPPGYPRAFVLRSQAPLVLWPAVEGALERIVTSFVVNP